MIPKKDLLYSTWNSTELCTSLGGKGVWGRMGTCTCVAESLKASPETVTTLLITYTSIQNKKFKVWKKKKRFPCLPTEGKPGVLSILRCSKLGPLGTRLRPRGWLGAHPGPTASTHSGLAILSNEEEARKRTFLSH